MNDDVDIIRIVGKYRFASGGKAHPIHLKYHAISVAAGKGSTAAVRVLAKEFGARVNPWGVRGEAPIHFAAANGHTEVIRLLVEELGALVDVRDEGGDVLDRVEGGERYYRGGGGNSVASGDAVEGECGDTALHIAAARGHCETARLLVQLGASVHACNQGGRTPLHLAAEGGHTAIALMLIKEAGADVDARDYMGYTCLHGAASKGRIETMRVLLVLGASVTAVCIRGRTPPSRCSCRGRRTCCLRINGSGRCRGPIRGWPHSPPLRSDGARW